MSMRRLRPVHVGLVFGALALFGVIPVSYTHLTLPTKA